MDLLGNVEHGQNGNSQHNYGRSAGKWTKPLKLERAAHAREQRLQWTDTRQHQPLGGLDPRCRGKSPVELVVSPASLPGHVDYL